MQQYIVVNVDGIDIGAFDFAEQAFREARHHGRNTAVVYRAPGRRDVLLSRDEDARFVRRVA